MSKKSFCLPLHKKAKHGKYANLEARLSSMKNWPCGLKQNGKLMAEAGFFYENLFDCVTCHFCGIILQKWEPGDDPWDQHLLWSSNCNFIYISKGRSYVENAKVRLKIKDEVKKRLESKILIDNGGSLVTGCWSLISSKMAQRKDGDKVTEENDDEEMSYKGSIKNLCSICLDKEANILFHPCYHICTCISDAVCIDSCLICRQKVLAICRVYFSC